MKKRLMNIKKERKIEEDEKRLRNTFDFFTVLNSIQLCKANAYTKKYVKKNWGPDKAYCKQGLFLVLCMLLHN